MIDLFPYQVEGARFLATAPSKGRLLADEPGLGKTAQAIAACDALGADRVMVVCPASVVEHWRREFTRFGQRREQYVQVIYYDAVSRGAEALQGGKWDVLILDEAHYLKNRTSKRTRVILGIEDPDESTRPLLSPGGLIGRADHVLLLTGTPTPNHPAELWPALHTLMPDAILGKNGKPLPYHGFVNKFCKTRGNGFGIVITGGKNLPELRERIAPFVLRRKKDDVLKDLPPIRFTELPLSSEFKMPPEVAALVPKVAAAIEAHGVDGLNAIASHVATLRRFTGLAKVAPASAWIRDALDGGIEKLVVFAYHREVLQALTVDAAKNGIGYACLTGATTDRQEEVDRFKNSGVCRVFFGQIQAAGVGISLTAASHLVLLEQSWVPAENEQAAMRIHRVGQNNACLVRVASLARSIDERISRAVIRKLETINALWA